MVIDVRGLAAIAFDPARETVEIGCGANLGAVYAALAPIGKAIPVGTCPSVGIAGHATAGGLGFLVRKFGLGCDSLLSFELVNAAGEIELASQHMNPDLFWALRGAGPGSFGVVTRMNFKVHHVPEVQTGFWRGSTSQEKATRFLLEWQDWFATAPREISGSVFCQKHHTNTIFMEVRVLSAGPSDLISRKLKQFTNRLRPGQRSEVHHRKFSEAVTWFSGDEDDAPAYTKSTSNVVKAPLTPEIVASMFEQMPHGVDAEFFTLGGAVSDLTDTETAFPHRTGSEFVIQWGVAWDRATDASVQLEKLTEFMTTVRPHLSKAAFLNYADCDLPNAARAYWGQNVERLRAVKLKYDPQNRFRHKLSVPVVGSI